MERKGAEVRCGRETTTKETSQKGCEPTQTQHFKLRNFGSPATIGWRFQLSTLSTKKEVR